MGKILAVVNQKGGVGKTTTAVNLTAALTEMGLDVLLCDFDPQANATSGLGIDKRKIHKSIYDVVVNGTDADAAIQKTKFGDVLPSSADLAGAAVELLGIPDREYQLQKALCAVKDEYDYILLDCPPSLGIITVNALCAADSVLVPIQCEYFALEGLSQLMFTISRIKQHYNKELNVTGILVTMHNNRLILSMQVINELKKHYADKLFETTISRNVKVSEAPGFGAPVYYHEKRSKGAIEYMNVAKQLAERI